jgi:hypothetical protein
LRIIASQVDIRPLLKLQQLFGGGIYPRTGDNNPRHAQSYEWTTSSRRASAALGSMLPYLTVKREVAELAIEFQALKSSHRLGVRLTPEQKADEEWHRQALHALNARGQPKGTVILPPKKKSAQLRLLKEA